MIQFLVSLYVTTELQRLRDDHCHVLWNSNNICPGRIFARYDKGHIYSTRKWRCYYEEALTGDRRHYDMQKKSPCYHSNTGLESFTNEGKVRNKTDGVVATG